MAYDYKQLERIDKIRARSFDAAEKLIFNWVKAGDINVNQFSELCSVNRA